MPNYTSKLSLPKPLGTENVTRTAHNELVDAIDLGAASQSDFDTHKEDTSLHMTSSEKTKLSGIESGAQVNTVTSVSGKTGAVTLTSSDVGAEPAFTKNSAFNKSFGTTSGTVAQGNHTHNYPVTSVNSKTGSVDLNASDVGAAPSSHDHDSLYPRTTTKGQQNGLASLDGSARLPTGQLPNIYRGFFPVGPGEGIAYQYTGGSITVQNTTWQKLRSSVVQSAGTYRVKFSLEVTNSSYAVYGQIRRNGVAVGTVRSTTSTTMVEFVEDISGWNTGDTLEFWAKADSGTYNGYLHYMKACTDSAVAMS